MEKSYESLSLFEFQQRFATDDHIWQQKNGKMVIFVRNAAILIIAQEGHSTRGNGHTDSPTVSQGY